MQPIKAQEHIALIDANTARSKKEVSKAIFSCVTSFRLAEGLMVVKAAVNQKVGNYIVDTGSPVLVLNTTPSRGATIQAMGISDKVEVKAIQVQQFNWTGIQRQDVDAFALDMSHLEMATTIDIAGIIGYDVLKDYQVFLDYSNRKIELLSFDKEKTNMLPPAVVIPFKLHGHLPIVKIRIGNKKLRLAIDTGSEVNILHDEYEEAIISNLNSAKFEEEIQGVDQKIKLVDATIVEQTKIRNASIRDMKYIFTDLSHLQANHLDIDGILGYPFLRSGKLLINYKKRKIYIFPTP